MPPTDARPGRAHRPCEIPAYCPLLIAPCLLQSLAREVREGVVLPGMGEFGMFAAFGAFFEFLIWGGLGGILRWVVPIALIAGGAYLLLKRDTPSEA